MGRTPPALACSRAVAYDRPMRRRAGILATVVVSLLAGATPATAHAPEFVPLSSGNFVTPPVRWEALAVRPSTIFLDLYDVENILFQTYNLQFAAPPPKKGVSALGYRPPGLPSTAALLGGVAGPRVKTVKVLFRGAPAQKLKPTPVPAEWDFRARFFATGAVVAESAAGLTQVVRKIKALDRKGKLLSTQAEIFTNPF